MVVNVDVMQMQMEMQEVRNICSTHKECLDCPFKKQNGINIGNSVFWCENGGNIPNES